MQRGNPFAHTRSHCDAHTRSLSDAGKRLLRGAKSSGLRRIAVSGVRLRHRSVLLQQPVGHTLRRPGTVRVCGKLSVRAPHSDCDPDGHTAYPHLTRDSARRDIFGRAVARRRTIVIRSAASRASNGGHI